MSERILSNTCMKQVKSYVNKLAMGIDDNPSEINEFKEEMTTNLVLSIQDLISEGYSENDAAVEAFDRFGQIGVLKDDLKQLYNFRTIFNKKLLTISIVIGMLSAIFIGTFYAYNFLYLEKKAQSILVENTNNLIKGSLQLEGVEKTLLDITKNPMFYSMTLFKTDATGGIKGVVSTAIDGKTVDVTPHHTAGRESFFIFRDGKSQSVVINDKTYLLKITYRTLENSFLVIGQILLIIYLSLFSIWSAQEIYFNNDSMLWLFIIVPTNFVGYLLYKSLTK